MACSSSVLLPSGTNRLCQRTIRRRLAAGIVAHTEAGRIAAARWWSIKSRLNRIVGANAHVDPATPDHDPEYRSPNRVPECESPVP